MKPCTLCGSAACQAADPEFCRTLRRNRRNPDILMVCSSCGSADCFSAGGDVCRHTRERRRARKVTTLAGIVSGVLEKVEEQAELQGAAVEL